MDVRRVRRAWNRRVPGPDGVSGFTAVASLATVALNASTSVTPSGTEGSDNSLPPRVLLGLVVALDAQSRVASSPGAANDGRSAGPGCSTAPSRWRWNRHGLAKTGLGVVVEYVGRGAWVNRRIRPAVSAR